jgi:hypothetical protein
MPMNETDIESVDPEGSATGGARPDAPAKRFPKRLVSAWLAFHLVAIVVAPASVEPASELTHAAWEVFSPYLETLYLNHGYHFFAPEPAESTLLSYEAERPDGTVVKGRIPDRATHPRLLYHRYFMLTEHMNGAADEVKTLWHESYAQHIGRKLGAQKVTLIKQTHLLPTAERIRKGARLDDPEGYENETLGVFPCDVY